MSNLANTLGELGDRAYRAAANARSHPNLPSTTRTLCDVMAVIEGLLPDLKAAIVGGPQPTARFVVKDRRVVQVPPTDGQDGKELRRLAKPLRKPKQGGTDVGSFKDAG